ncbi:MAG: hypothetical protein R3E96_11770 [Planctomycetota bacterium]
MGDGEKASATRLGLLPDEIARAKLEATQALESALSLGPEAQLKPHGQLALSKARLARASQEALETEQALLTALRDLDPLRSDRYQRRKERLTSRVDRLRTMVADLRTAQAEQAAQQASSQAQQLEERSRFAAGIRVLKELALEIVQLSERGLPQQKLAADAALERAKRDRDAIQERYKRSLRRMQYGGLTEGMGRTLREDFEWLPKRRSLQDQAQQRRQELSECQLALLDIDTDSRSIADSEVALLRLLDRIGVSDTESPVALYVRDLLRQKAQLQADAQRSLDELANTLGQHQQVQAQIEKSANEYRAYIEGRILWIKSTRSAFRGGLNDLFGQAWQWLSIWAKPSTWTDILHSLRARGSGAGTFLFFALLLLALRRVIWRRREEMHKAVRSRRSDRFALTLRALAQTVLLALPLPLLLWAVASVLDMSYTQMDSAFDLSAERITRSAARALAEDEDQVVRSLLQGAGAALSHVALVVFALLILLGVAQEKGIGELHFRWNPLTTELVRRQMRWFLPVIVVLTAIYRALYGRDAHFSSSGWNVLHLSDTVGRVAFCLAMAALALFLTRIGHPESPIWSQRATRKQGLMVKVHTFWTTAAMLIPVALIVLALLGYYYTALRLDLRMQWSLGFGLVLVLVHHVLLRWLNITRWKLAVAQAREKAKARAAALAETPVESTESAVMPAFDEATVDLPALDSQTRQLFKSGVTIGALVGLYLIWASALPALEGLDNVQLWPELRIVSPTDAVPGNGLSLANAELVAPTGESGAPKDPGSEAAAPRACRWSPVACRRPPPPKALLVAGLPASLTLGDVVVATLILLLTFAAARNLPGLPRSAFCSACPWTRVRGTRSRPWCAT